MKLAIVGAGSIGAFVGGCLLWAGQEDLILVGRPSLQRVIEQHGLTICGVGIDGHINLPPEKVHFRPSILDNEQTQGTHSGGLADRDIIFVAVKSRATEQVAIELSKAQLPSTTVIVSLQNGVNNARVLQEHLPSNVVIGGVVGFNVVWQGKATFHKGTANPIVLGAINRPRDPSTLHRVEEIERKLFHLLSKQAKLHVELTTNIEGVQWTKLLMNLNNAIQALSGISLKQELENEIYRAILAACQREALQVLKAHGIGLQRIGILVPSLFPYLMTLPNFIFLRLSPVRPTDEARGSMWEDLARGNPTEIDQLNGTVVAMAQSKGIEAPANKAIISLIRRAEEERKAPQIPPGELYELVMGKPYHVATITNSPLLFLLFVAALLLLPLLLILK